MSRSTTTARLSQDDFIEGAATECGVGTIVWSTQIGYDAGRIDEAPQSWADFWNTEKWPGTRALRRGPKYTLEFALMADGVPAGEVYDVLRTEEGVERAFAKLDELRDNLIWWEAGAQPLQMLASGEVVMTSIYNGRMTGSNRDEGTNFAGVWPGSIYSIDSWVILEGSDDVELAHDLHQLCQRARAPGPDARDHCLWHHPCGRLRARGRGIHRRPADGAAEPGRRDRTGHRVLGREHREPDGAFERWAAR
jgi:spermidine/putrescine-binding protein